MLAIRIECDEVTRTVTDCEIDAGLYRCALTEIDSVVKDIDWKVFHHVHGFILGAIINDHDSNSEIQYPQQRLSNDILLVVRRNNNEGRLRVDPLLFLIDPQKTSPD